MPESLIREWEKYDREGVNTAVLLIDEQGDFDAPGNQPDLIRNQRAILQLVDQFNHAIACFIELNPTMGSPNPLPAIPTNPELTLCVNDIDKKLRIEKQYFSAFDGTNLLSVVKHRNIEVLIVMGHVADHCVKHTIYGGPRDYKGTIRALGALNFGLKVLSSASVVSGDIGGWKHSEDVVLCDII